MNSSNRSEDSSHNVGIINQDSNSQVENGETSFTPITQISSQQDRQLFRIERIQRGGCVDGKHEKNKVDKSEII